MATRKILHRRRSLINILSNSRCSFPSFSGSGSGQSSYPRSSWGSHCSAAVPCMGSDSAKEKDSITKHKLHLLSDAGLLQKNLCRNPELRLVRAHPSYGSSLRAAWLSQLFHYSTTVAAGQPEVQSGNNTNEEKVTESKEPSPEECDQAVKGLSSIKAKAKAKAKQLQEPQKSENSILRRVWAKLLGIGPALRAVGSISREDWANKLCDWKDEFKSTLQHYWLGMKLLWVDVRISLRLLLKLLRGKSLSRRERQQLTRTTADIFRLVPFAVFVIVPFMEFLLPVFLKLFPNMLPSTFKDKTKEEEELRRRLHARIEMARFLQDTVKEMAKEVQDSRSGEIKKTAEDLDEFINKVRNGERVSNEDILAFAKLFNDELTLDNMSRPRLVNMCKYMGITPFGTDAYSRFMLRNKLRKIKEDDKMIQAEGVESLSEEELRQACRERGMLGSLSVEEMRQQLRDWLDLSLNHSVPSSLLILSRAFSVPGRVKPEEAVEAAISSLPDEVVGMVGATSLPSGDPISERRRKLEFLEMQEKLIKEEEKRRAEDEEKGKVEESTVSQKDVALQEMVDPIAKEAEERAKAELLDKDDQLCELSRALAVLASAPSMSGERKEFLKLVNKEIELYNSMVDKEGKEGEAEAQKAYKAARKANEDGTERDPVTSALIDRVDKMLLKLEKDIDDVDAKMWRLLDRDGDGTVTREEVATAAAHLQETLDSEGLQELISKLSKDKDGKIHVKDLVKLASQRKTTTESQG